MVTLLMNLRSVRSKGVFVFIKSLANVTLVRLRPLVNSHYVSSSGAGSGEQFGAQFTLKILLSVEKYPTWGRKVED